MTQAEREGAILSLKPIVRRYARRRATQIRGNAMLDPDDLEATGWIAAIRAVDNFDPNFGVPLEAYAARVIDGGISNELRRHDPVCERDRRMLRRADTTRREIDRCTGRTPSSNELDRLLPGYLRALARAQRGTISLDAPISTAGEKGDVLLALFAGDADTERTLVSNEQADELRQAIISLDDRRRTVIEKHYFGDETLDALAKTLGVSPQRISQIHLSAIKTLQQNLKLAS